MGLAVGILDPRSVVAELDSGRDDGGNNSGGCASRCDNLVNVDDKTNSDAGKWFCWC